MPRQPATLRAACFTNSGGPVSIGTLTRSKPSGASNRVKLSSNGCQNKTQSILSIKARSTVRHYFRVYFDADGSGGMRTTLD